MKDDKGKVIFSLIAGATAGIVAGLLLAPETGDDARSNLRKSATKFGGDLSKLVKDALAKAQGQAPSAHTNPDAAVSEDKQAADRLLQNLGTGTPSTVHTQNEDNTDYDGFGDDTRHQPNL
ncbi:YtxH domain-containing protein [Hymenobacter siberiensis]|jgi:gas vesicle protein|uniref:YtxH domain-containing protein n=1 Tax=Hymenobacter siberiensis TaxID=2848396 RepID=UPI001C1E163A|nr:YtxH domain-containing protein [Hymenobacter siberiensis]MBU6122803.1 YtxH domain-containing protein [Hymenobacter siberiensis]